MVIVGDAARVFAAIKGRVSPNKERVRVFVSRMTNVALAEAITPVRRRNASLQDLRPAQQAVWWMFNAMAVVRIMFVPTALVSTSPAGAVRIFAVLMISAKPVVKVTPVSNSNANPPDRRAVLRSVLSISNATLVVKVTPVKADNASKVPPPLVRAFVQALMNVQAVAHNKFAITSNANPRAARNVQASALWIPSAVRAVRVTPAKMGNVNKAQRPAQVFA
jgi:hypothetical protein